MYSAYKLNKQGDNIQPVIFLSQFWTSQLFHVLYASWPTYRFLRRQVRWSGIPITLRIFQFAVIHIVKDFSVVNEAEVDVFLEFSCFLYYPTNVDNLISGSSAFSKSIFTYCWSLVWRILSIILLGCAVAAKSLQSCPTLCDLIDCSLPGSSVHGIFQARVLEWGAIAFSD